MRLFISFCTFVLVLFTFPFFCQAFSVNPSTVDIPFSVQESTLEQTISVTNTEESTQEYRAEVKEVLFDAYGNISTFSDVSPRLDMQVEDAYALLSSGESHVFIVHFLHPELVTASQVFALYITERSYEGQEVSSAFAALLFPQGISTEESSFRIDSFGVFPDDSGIRVVAQLTNTSDQLVRPMSIIVVKNRFDHEIGRFVFAQQEGRLPVGTTRTLSSVLPTTMFGMWHIGGDVQMTLISVADAGGEVQQATVMYTTSLGKGFWILGGVFALIFIGAILFLFRRRGILHM